MTTLWIVVGVVGYLAIGVAVARVVSTPRDHEVDRAAYVVLWPMVVSVLSFVGVIWILNRLAGGK